MTLSEFGALGELIGGVAVVVSLVYLAFQIRDSTRSARASRAQAVMSAAQSFAGVLAADTPPARVFRLGMLGSGELSEDESVQFYAQLTMMFRNFENAFAQFQLRDRDDLAWKPWEATMERYAVSPGFDEFWANSGSSYGRDFGKVVDAVRERQHAAAQQGIEPDVE